MHKFCGKLLAVTLAPACKLPLTSRTFARRYLHTNELCVFLIKYSLLGQIKFCLFAPASVLAYAHNYNEIQLVQRSFVPAIVSVVGRKKN